ncbi:type II toxin-antitoxin system RelE/ParE family toxin [Methylosinus sp. Sm6]|uniref:type II toxin-antitoxin system RelE/ParE family toxin n=1 Tax=Methylosinus sp. Sm6 TaxID=2866948 RepID=UPI001C9917A8|nr:type II toxin-antitoxin system RelE/ParE family toxin [Methylosinus sp. Sm6]MBY6244097.1 type II toxin-antitoxin system RelE/ParE family toxin [Methylosinus sp. Sm6]
MGKYRLSVQAVQQIRDIGRFTMGRFGAYQARAYHAGLERTFGLLADFPKMGVAADELLTGGRRFRFQSHEIFYIEEGDSILIRAVFHTAQSVRPDLFDER